MAGDSHWESNFDCCITRVVVNNGFLEIYGYDKEWRSKEMLLEDIEFGHIGYIIDEIPEINEVHDVTIKPSVNVIPIVNLCRDDIEDAGYNPNVTDDELQQIASRIGKYLEWQEFYPQFLENVRDACDYLNIQTLNAEEDE